MYYVEIDFLDERKVAYVLGSNRFLDERKVAYVLCSNRLSG